MTSRQDIIDYTSMETLLQSPEWRVWGKFINARIERLKNDVVEQVASGKPTEAIKTVAVIKDLKKQINLFLSKKSELEKKLSS